MKVSLFGLFLRGASLMGPWLKLIQSILLIIGFIRISGFMILYLFMSCLSTYILFHNHLCSSWFATWLSHHTRLGSIIWLPWILMSRSWSLEHVRAWSEWILPVADQSGAAVAWISSRPSVALSFQALLFASRVFLFINSWVPLYCSYLYISMYSRNCAF